MNNKHDRTFREILSNPDYFVSLCKAHLPKPLLRRIDWTSVNVAKLPTDWVKNLAPLGLSLEKQGDVLYEFRYKNREKGLLLISAEHQSSNDPLLALRLAVYLHLLLLEYAKMHKLKQLPTVMQILVYHGKQSFCHSLEVKDLFADQALANKYYQKPLLVDLTEIDDKAIAAHGLISPLEYALKKTYKKRLSKAEVRLFALIIAATYPDNSLPDEAKVVLNYGLDALEYDSKQFIDVLYETLPQFGSNVMTIAEQLRQQGAKRAAEETARQIALNLFSVVDDPKKIAKVTKLPLSEVKKLAKTVEQSNHDK